MKFNFKLIFILVIVIFIVSSSIFMFSLNAATTTHEAEANTNNLKNATISGNYVQFNAVKDAYIELKNVNAPGSGNATIVFVYSNSSSSSIPVEIKVNGATIKSNEPFQPTGGSWSNKSISANVNSGTNNVIRFKIRSAIAGMKLDKIQVTNDGSSNPQTTSITRTTSNPQVVSPSPIPSSSQNANYKIESDGRIHILSGTFDGGGKSYGSNIGDGSQNESQPPVFELEVGANLKNCVIVPPAGDGIHVHGNNTIESVTFTDVGEDAISMGSSTEGGNITIRNCSFSNAEDKVLQVNKESTWYLYNLTVNTAGKIMRQNGGKTFPLTVYIDGIKATGIKEAVVRSDSPSCKVYYKNISCNLPASEWWMGELSATQW